MAQEVPLGADPLDNADLLESVKTEPAVVSQIVALHDPQHPTATPSAGSPTRTGEALEDVCNVSNPHSCSILVVFKLIINAI